MNSLDGTHGQDSIIIAKRELTIHLINFSCIMCYVEARPGEHVKFGNASSNSLLSITLQVIEECNSLTIARKSSNKPLYKS